MLDYIHPCNRAQGDLLLVEGIIDQSGKRDDIPQLDRALGWVPGRREKVVLWAK